MSMELTSMIETVLREQKDSSSLMPVDIKITNGNILLRSFYIHELNKKNGTIKGITFQEDYIHTREKRNPVLCILDINNIKELFSWELDIHYSKDAHPTFAFGEPK